MRFPTALQYAESLSNHASLLRTLGSLEPTIAQDGELQFSSGNFGCVFQVRYAESSKALKCFTREQRGRLVAYRLIAEHLTNSSSPYIIDYSFLEQEILVFDQWGDSSYYPTLLMEWVDGQTLTLLIDKLASHDDRDALKELSAKFDAMALWLLEQPFAHGDLKPDNIMVRNNGQMVLIDYDGVFTPEMSGERARENGTPGFQHPLRSADRFDKHIDDYSIALISITLRAIAADPTIWRENHGGDGIILQPSQIISGISACYNRISSTELGQTSLFKSLCRDDPNFDDLRELILESSPSGLEKQQAAPPREVASPNDDGLYSFKSNGLFGYINSSFKTAIEPSFEKAEEFSDGLAAIKHQGMWGYIDTSGRLVIPCLYQKAASFSEGLSAVSFAGKWGYIDKMGRSVSGFKFDDAWSFSEGVGLIRRGEKYGYIGSNGRMNIAARYQFAQSFSEGSACVMLEGKWGYIGHNGRWIYPPEYDYAKSCRNGQAYVERGDRSFVLDFVNTYK